jgi:acyl-CoA thioester hydrolase
MTLIDANNGAVIMKAAVLPEWVDYNGHMNYAFYVVAFDQATDVIFDYLDLGASYREKSSATLFVVETHVAYLRELKINEEFVVETVIGDADQKRLHLFQRLIHRERGVCATSEVLSLHVFSSGNGPKAAPFSTAHFEGIVRLMERQVGYPKELSRSIAIKRPVPARA